MKPAIICVFFMLSIELSSAASPTASVISCYQKETPFSAQQSVSCTEDVDDGGHCVKIEHKAKGWSVGDCAPSDPRKLEANYHLYEFDLGSYPQVGCFPVKMRVDEDVPVPVDGWTLCICDTDSCNEMPGRGLGLGGAIRETNKKVAVKKIQALLAKHTRA